MTCGSTCRRFSIRHGWHTSRVQRKKIPYPASWLYWLMIRAPSAIFSTIAGPTWVGRSETKRPPSASGLPSSLTPQSAQPELAISTCATTPQGEIKSISFIISQPAFLFPLAKGRQRPQLLPCQGTLAHAGDWAVPFTSRVTSSVHSVCLAYSLGASDQSSLSQLAFECCVQAHEVVGQGASQSLAASPQRGDSGVI